MSKARVLSEIFNNNMLDHFIGVHDALSALIAQETGFPGVWISGLGLSATSGVRDSNELSWTQIVERIELLSDRISVPALVDADTGFGNFNNVRLVFRKFARIGVGGACIEDKVFPKTNSFIGTGQDLADPAEFCGRIKAAKDTVGDEVFVVARCEAFVAGCTLTEAIDRCGLYVDSDADAILIHSKKNTPDEVLAFMSQWDGRAPVTIVPTKYSYVTPDVFEAAGISVVIWANQVLRASLKAMEQTCEAVRKEGTMLHIESEIADLSRVFELTDNAELEQAKKLYSRYIPPRGGTRRLDTDLVTD